MKYKDLLDHFVNEGTLESFDKGLCKIALGDEDLLEDVPLWFPYGYEAIPKPGETLLVLGLRNSCVAIACAGSWSMDSGIKLDNKEGGTLHLSKEKILIKGIDLIEKQKELIDILVSLVGSTNAPNGPVVFPPDFITKLQRLKSQWK